MSTTFHSWASSGVRSSAGADGTLEPAVSVNGAGATGPSFQLLGPEAVVGLRDSVVDRRYPLPDSREAVTNHLATLTLCEADLPWRFRRGAATGGGLSPWIALVVVPEAEPGGPTYSPNSSSAEVPGPLGILTVPPECARRDLPDLEQAWAWAHVEGDPSGDPSAARSRLVCPRRLSPETLWRACVVPTTVGGVRAGLTSLTPEADDSPAWDASETPTVPIELPVYLTWTFATGERADFETLCKRLVFTGPGDAGTRRVRATGIDGVGAEERVTVAGVLEGEAVDLPDPPESVSHALATLTDPVDGDPVVAPPRWGDGLEGERATWADELAATPAHRVAAGAGAEAVRAHDQALVDGLWRAVGDRGRSRRLEDRARMVGVLGERWAQRLSGASDETRVHVASALLRSRSDVAASMADAQVSESLIGPALARRTSRASTLQEATLITPVLTGTALQLETLRTVHSPPEPVSAIREVDTFSVEAEDSDDGDGGRTPLTGPVGPFVPPSRPARPGTLRRRPPRPPPPHRPGQPAPPPADRAAPVRWADRFDRGPGPDLEGTPRTDSHTPVDLSDLAVESLRVGTARMERVQERQETDGDGDPIRVDHPLVESLISSTPELLLPGLTSLGDNVVTLLGSRADGIAAALMGANHELAREILWREIPIAPGDAWWRSFWEAGTEDLLTPADDRTLAELLEPDAVPLVLLVRGDLIERFPDVRVRLAEGEGDGDSRRPRTGGTVVEPDFENRVDARTTLYGFRGMTDGQVRGDDGGGGWYVVLEEAQEALRFGLEPDELAGDGPAAWDDVSWGDLEPRDWDAMPHLTLDAAGPSLAGLLPRWGASAAATAALLARRPFRVLIHGSVLLADEGETP